MEPTRSSGRGFKEPRLRSGAIGARTVVLVLYGGQADGTAPSRPWHLAALRLRPVEAAVAARSAGRDIAVATVRYRLRGWNGVRADAALDASHAVETVARWPGAPRIVLVGHSMGGRAALHAAAHPQVVGVVALAPWWPAEESVVHLRGKHLQVFHDPSDRVTDPVASRLLVTRARDAGARASWTAVPGGGHAMLGHARTWHRLAAEAVLRCAHTGRCAAAPPEGVPPVP